MAKGSRDLILRDRLQFALDSNGDRSLVYGRVDLSDFVNIIKKEGMAVKEVRYNLRLPTAPNGVLVPTLSIDSDASIKVFCTTTAYKNAADVGIASPDVINLMEQTTSVTLDGAGVAGTVNNLVRFYGTPDLHPEGYNVVSDLLIGVAANNLARFASSTLEIDIMVIGEPVKLSDSDMTEMLTQAQDL
ncbi:unnamed protein product [marine sediment metagenome]|uniref:Uncharacterized protein n=1 Tax=marine sediment metagenome TaxID=412755 RepID=X0YU04_9ZZZZ